MSRYGRGYGRDYNQPRGNYYAAESSSESDSESDSDSGEYYSPPDGTHLEVVKYDGRPMWNVMGSSQCKCFREPPDSPYRTPTWIQMCEMVTGRERGRCSFRDCPNDATLGGHLQYVTGRGPNIWYLAPICTPCNSTFMDDKPGRLRFYSKIVEVRCSCTE